MSQLELTFVILIVFFLLVGVLLYWDTRASRSEGKKKQAVVES